jgi:CSLREA domain-containing protein
MSRPVHLRVPLLLAAALAVSAPFAGSAHAATITVTTVLDADAADGFCSLREAILAANDDVAHNECPAGDGPDRIVFGLTTPAEINLTADLPTITETLLIRGSGPLQIIIDGADLYRLLNFDTPAGGGWLGVERLTLYRGRAPGGGGGDGGGANIGAGETAFFRRVWFVENRSANGGGGLAVGSATGANQTTATVLECLFQSNVAEGAGGGGGLLLAGTDGEVRVVRSTFVDNGADHENGAGGGILAARGTLVLEASTVSGNRASDNGGGVLLLVSGVPPLSGAILARDSTITENVAEANGDNAGDGGGIAFIVGTGFTADVELVNTVVAGNLDSGALLRPDFQCGGDVQVNASGTSFVGANDGCDAQFPAGSPNAAGDYVGTAATPLDPLLQPLGDNGGPLPTHRPEPPPPFGDGASPLVDQGSCPDVIDDQRGFGDETAVLRRFDLPEVSNPPGGDGCDIGAVEVNADPRVDPTLFADGFEAGHTLMWSSEVLF